MILSDDEIIVNTQGIRYVHKWDGYNHKFRLGVQYKGCNLNQEYPTKEARDNMFNKLQEEMLKKEKKQ